MANQCFAEAWIRNERAITFLGASRPSYTNANHDFDEYLFEAIIDEGLTTAGEIMNWGKTRLLLNYPGHSGTPARDNVRMYLLLGDPTAAIEPKVMQGTYTIQQKSNNRFMDAHESGSFSVVTRPAQNNDTQRWLIKAWNSSGT